MEAVRTRQATIDDLIERLLDKGVIVNLDLVIGVAGIPLIGVNLRAAIASIGSDARSRAICCRWSPPQGF